MSDAFDFSPIEAQSKKKRVSNGNKAAGKVKVYRARADEHDDEDAGVPIENTAANKNKGVVVKSKSLMGLAALSDGEKLRELQAKYETLKKVCDDGVEVQAQLKATSDSREAASKELIEQLRAENARLKKQLDSSKSASAALVSAEELLRLSDENARLSTRCEHMLRTLALYDTMTSVTVESSSPTVFRCRCANARRADGRYAVFDLTLNPDDEIEFTPIDLPAALDAPAYMRDAICFDSHDLPQLLSNLLSVVHKVKKSN